MRCHREFRFVSAAVAGGVTGAVCNSGVTCDLLSLAVDQRVTITIVADVPANVIMGTYINTATVSRANFESNTANNTAGAATAVSQNAALQVRKAANPATATAGQALAYTILVTNTGPSDAANVTVADTLPAGFNLALVTPSQGGCAGFPCNLGTVVAGGNASVYLYGTVSTNVTGTLTNTVSVSSATSGTGATFTLTTPISGTADLSARQDRHGDGAAWRPDHLHADRLQPRPIAGAERADHRHVARQCGVWQRQHGLHQR